MTLLQSKTTDIFVCMYVQNISILTIIELASCLICFKELYIFGSEH